MQHPLPPQLAPLYWPDGNRPPEPWGVYVLFYVLIIGSFVAGFVYHQLWIVLTVGAMWGIITFHHRSGGATVQHLASQLKKRSSFPIAAWGLDERAAFAETVGRIVAEEIPWPNPHFLPQDPLNIVFFCPSGDGAEGVAISYNFENIFGRPCEFPEVQTFGEFIDHNLARSPDHGAPQAKRVGGPHHEW